MALNFVGIEKNIIFKKVDETKEKEIIETIILTNANDIKGIYRLYKKYL